MGLAEVVESSLSRMRRLLQEETSDDLAGLELSTSNGYNVKDEIDETERKIQELSQRLKADEERKQQLMKDVAEKKNELEKVAADLKVKEDDTSKEKQKLANLEVRKLHASAGFSAKDARSKEKVVNAITAYVNMTGASFDTPHEGYIVNYCTKKAKFFKVQGVPKKAATETIWNTINSAS